MRFTAATMNSPSRLARAGGSGKSKLREVKSGILLSDALIPSTAVAPTARVPKGLRAPIIRTKSGNLRKIASKEAFAALTAEEDSSGTRVTSRFARVLLAGSGFLADAVRNIKSLLLTFCKCKIILHFIGYRLPSIE